MKIILTQEMHELGLEGDIVDVAKGYARNYLIPKGIALEANEQNIKLMETKRKKIEAKRFEAKEEAKRSRKGWPRWRSPSPKRWGKRTSYMVR